MEVMGSPTITNKKLRHLFAQNIRGYLAQNEWSEHELARRCGISQKQINNLVRERYGCTIEAADLIAKTFNMPLWQLLVWGRSQSSASPESLQRVMVAYLNSSAEERKVFDTLARSKSGA